MRLLDLYSGAGGAARGYQQAGFHVTGVDIKPQPRYAGDEFILADALDYLATHGHEFDAVHASPPCQAYSKIRAIWGHRERPDLVPPTREALRAVGVPYVIENVVEAHLRHAVILCGSSFGLDLRRHRAFETGFWEIGLVPPCSHSWQRPRFRSLDRRVKTLASVVGVHGNVNYRGEAELRKQAMGIEWMTQQELVEAIPPAYCEFIGRQLMTMLTSQPPGRPGSGDSAVTNEQGGQPS